MTVQECINAAKIGYPSLPDYGTPSVAVNIFNEVHNDILTRCNVQNDTEAIVLVADTQVYDLAVTARFACTCMYIRSASDNDVVKLVSRSQDEFETEQSDYLSSSSGEPTSYFITHKSDSTVRIGFYPKPDTSSSPATTSGYPRVELRVGRGATLVAGGNLPLGVPRWTAWIKGIQAVWSERRNLPDKQTVRQEYEYEIGLLQSWRHNFQQESPSVVVPAFAWRRRTRE